MIKRYFIFSLLVAFLAGACSDDEFGPVLSEIVAPVLSSPTDGSSFTFTEDNKDDLFPAFSWSAADYGFDAGVDYTLQFDNGGNNFAAPINLSTVKGRTTVDDLTNNDLNEKLIVKGLPGGVAAAVEFRVVADVNDDVEIVYSNTLTLNITPYETVIPCEFDQLYIVGSAAVDAGWDWATPVVLNCEGKVTSGKIRLTNGAFRFFTVKDEWASGRNFPYYEGLGYVIDPLLENANDGDSNFQFTGDDGIYTIELDENAKTITLTPSGSLWLVGAATPGGWDWAAPTEATEIAPDVWQATFALANEAFRFFTEKDNWDSGLNYPYYEGEGYTIDSNFENANDGDSNFRFIGTPGTYTLTVNAGAKTITLE